MSLDKETFFEKVASESSRLLLLRIASFGIKYAVPGIVIFFWNHGTLGLFVYVESIVLVLSRFATLGTEGGLRKFVAVWDSQDEDGEITGVVRGSVAVTLIVGSSLVALCGILVFVDVIRASPDEVAFVAVSLLAIPVVSVMQLVSGTCAGLKLPAEGLWRGEIFYYLLFLGLTLAIGASGWAGPWVIVAFAGAAFVGACVGLSALTSHVGPDVLRWETGQVRSVVQSDFFKYSVFVLALTGLSFLSARADKIVLGSFVDREVLGRYFMVGLVAGGLTIFQRVTNGIASPFFATLWAENRQDRLRAFYRVVAKFAFTGALPLAVLLGAAVSKFAVTGGFLGAYSDLDRVAYVLFASQLAAVSMGPINILCMMIGLERVLLRINVVVAVVGLVGLYVSARFGPLVAVASVTGFTILAPQLAAYWHAGRRAQLKAFDRDHLYLVVVVSSLAALGWLTVMSKATSTMWMLIVASAFLFLSYAGSFLVWRESSHRQTRETYAMALDRIREVL